MESQVEKMYENAGIKPLCQIPDEYCGMKNVYEDFTAEKQIELIKNICPAYPLNYRIKCFQGYSFEEGLAKCINNLWQYLTEEDKAQIKEILSE